MGELQSLDQARALVSALRFSGDTLPRGAQQETSQLGDFTGFMAEHGLEISENVTPDLHTSLLEACTRLLIPAEAVDAFVFPSAECNAACFSDRDDRCILRFSSSLIELLSREELLFVIGHELGHFLLGHSRSLVGQEESVELYIQGRAQEISSDRVGLLTCQSLDHSINAMMKLASGLSDDYLRFDVSTFIRQIRHVAARSLSNQFGLLHPSLLVRSRALLWLEMEGVLSQVAEGCEPRNLEKIDTRVEDDLSRYVDGPARKRIAEARETLSMWIFMREIIKTESFTKNEQATFQSRFGKDLLNKMLGFLSGQSRTQVTEAVEERLRRAAGELRALIPITFTSVTDELKEEARALLKTNKNGL
jgi:hypothetical protein